MARIRGFELVGDGATLPKRATSKSAGYDLHAAGEVTIPPRATVLVPTNVTVYMLDDEWFEIKARSGLSVKQFTAVGAGVIDADYYPKPIGVIIHSQSDEPITFKVGAKIAQGIFQKYLIADGDDVDAARNGGYGSTGDY